MFVSASVANHSVQMAEIIQSFLDERCRLVRVAYVSCHTDGLGFRIKCIEFAYGLLKRFLASPGHHQSRTALHHAIGNFTADTFAGTCNDDNLSGQVAQRFFIKFWPIQKLTKVVKASTG